MAYLGTVTGDPGDVVRPAVPAARLLEIACDESGSEGENLLGGNTDVFAHASVQLSIEAATKCIQETRHRIRSPATEYKANHLLRGKHRSVLTWLLGPSGPIRGRAHVLLIEKRFFVVDRVVHVLAGEVTDAGRMDRHRDERAVAMAVALYRDGESALGRTRWQAFLESSNDLLRTRNGLEASTAADPFFAMLEAMHLSGRRDHVGAVMQLLRRAGPRVELLRARLLDDPATIPVLDPLIPAIIRAVLHWGDGGRPVSVVHDEQRTLTEERIARLKEMFGEQHPAPRRDSRRGRLIGLRLVDSRSDSRVQVADFLAGVARKIASDELNGRGDAELTALLRPYVAANSIWGDDRSWSALGPVHRDPSGSRPCPNR